MPGTATSARRRKGRRRELTAEQATTFQGVSTGNALALTMAAKARGCKCEPYRDWYTFARWQAQGFTVRKGEHGVKLSVIYEKDSDELAEGEEPKRLFTRAVVFCRCQVAPIGEGDNGRR